MEIVENYNLYVVELLEKVRYNKMYLKIKIK